MSLSTCFFTSSSYNKRWRHASPLTDIEETNHLCFLLPRAAQTFPVLPTSMAQLVSQHDQIPPSDSMRKRKSSCYKQQHEGRWKRGKKRWRDSHGSRQVWCLAFVLISSPSPPSLCPLLFFFFVQLHHSRAVVVMSSSSCAFLGKNNSMKLISDWRFYAWLLVLEWRTHSKH